MVEEGQEPQRDGVPGGLAPGDDEQEEEQVQLDLAERRALTVVGLDFDRRQDRPDVVLRIGPLLLAEPLRVLEHLDLEAELLLGDVQAAPGDACWRKSFVTEKSHSRSSTGMPTMSAITFIGSL